MLGLLAMAMSHSIGSEVQKPLAVVVIGGLVSATLLKPLVCAPYYWVERDTLTSAARGYSPPILTTQIDFWASQRRLRASRRRRRAAPATVAFPAED
jgi:hypothetical protein